MEPNGGRRTRDGALGSPQIRNVRTSRRRRNIRATLLKHNHPLASPHQTATQVILSRVSKCWTFFYVCFFRNGSFLTQSRLQEFHGSNKISDKSISSPNLNLLLKFQRLLITKIYSRDRNVLPAAESLLKKYLHQLTTHVTDTITTAYDVATVNPKNYMYVLDILKGDFVGKF